MHEVVLFFPDIQSLAAYAALLNSGPAEINSQQLTLKLSLSQEQIADACLLYEAVCCRAETWEGLQRWFDYCNHVPIHMKWLHAEMPLLRKPGSAMNVYMR